MFSNNFKSIPLIVSIGDYVCVYGIFCETNDSLGSASMKENCEKCFHLFTLTRFDMRINVLDGMNY